MAGLWQTIKGWFSGDNKQSQHFSLTGGDLCVIASDIYVRELAFWSCVNLIANAVSKSVLKTYQNHKEVKQAEYYRWNVEPNANQTSSEFWHKVLAKLYRENECLVVVNRDALLVADSFNTTPNEVFGNSYTDVQVGEITFKRTFQQNEVFYFKLSEQDMNLLISGLYNSYYKLIDAGMNDYQSERIVRAVFEMGTATIPTDIEDDVKKVQDYMATRFKPFFTPNNGNHSILPLRDGEDMKEFGNKGAYAKGNSRDVRSLIDDVTDFTARAFGIPVSIVNGEVQDTSKAIEQLMTFCIGPLLEMLEQEINRKLIKYNGFIKGNYFKFDMSGIQFVDILKSATSIDKLISSGAYSVNDVRKLCTQPSIDEPWADEHFMTKNYAQIQEEMGSDLIEN